MIQDTIAQEHLGVEEEGEEEEHIEEEVGVEVEVFLKGVVVTTLTTNLIVVVKNQVTLYHFIFLNNLCLR